MESHSSFIFLKKILSKLSELHVFNSSYTQGLAHTLRDVSRNRQVGAICVAKNGLTAVVHERGLRG
jgi:hypothetical protein